jgi:hypothetical protein
VEDAQERVERQVRPVLRRRRQRHQVEHRDMECPQWFLGSTSRRRRWRRGRW